MGNVAHALAFRRQGSGVDEAFAAVVLFDLILLPEHDRAPNRPNIFRTTGMLSPVMAGEKIHLKV